MVKRVLIIGTETHHATWRVYRNDNHQLVGVFAASCEAEAIQKAAEFVDMSVIVEVGFTVGIHGNWFYAILEPV